MSFIATNATTVGEAVDYCERTLLDGLYAESITRTRKGDVDRNAAARHAITQMAALLREVYCADRDTLLADVALPV